METKDHLYLAKLITGTANFGGKLKKSAFEYGCISPDVNPLTYVKGHTYAGTASYVRNTLSRLHGKLKSPVDYFDLGRAIHFIGDYFTFPHTFFFMAAFQSISAMKIVCTAISLPNPTISQPKADLTFPVQKSALICLKMYLTSIIMPEIPFQTTGIISDLCAAVLQCPPQDVKSECQSLFRQNSEYKTKGFHSFVKPFISLQFIKKTGEHCSPNYLKKHFYQAVKAFFLLLNFNFIFSHVILQCLWNSDTSVLIEVVFKERNEHSRRCNNSIVESMSKILLAAFSLYSDSKTSCLCVA